MVFFFNTVNIARIYAASDPESARDKCKEAITRAIKLEKLIHLGIVPGNNRVLVN